MTTRTGAARIAAPAPTVARTSDTPSPARVPRTASPAAADPQFQRLLAQVQRAASRHRQHPPAATRVAEAQAAAAPPTNEAAAVAAAAHLDALQAAPSPPPRTDGFLARLRAELARVAPRTQGDAAEFLAGDDRRRITDAVRDGVRGCHDDAAGPLVAVASAAPDPAAGSVRTPTPIPVAVPVAPDALDLRAAVPPPRPAAEVSQRRVLAAADARIGAAGLATPQLQRARDPRFTAVLAARGDLDVRVAAAPARFRSAEQRAAAVGITRAAADARVQLATFAGQRGRTGAAVQTRQQIARERDERRRKAVTDRVEAIHAAARARVERALATLEVDVMAAFDGGTADALADLQAWTAAEIDRWKADRYTGLAGAALWVADLVRPVPPEVRQILARGKLRFDAAIDGVATRVAGLIDARLLAARAAISAGHAEVAALVAGLPADLKAVGKAAEADVQARFAELESGVDARQQALVDGLAGRYRDARDQADAALASIGAAHDGALAGLADRVTAAADVVAQFKARLTAVLRKGEATIKLILADPVGFFGRLIAAVRGGLDAFVGNIRSWLLQGLADWLFGNLAAAGVTRPADLSLAAIFKLVLEVLGLTYPKIRARAVKLVGEPAVRAVETLAEFVRVFVTGGAAALWDQLKDRLAELKTTVVDALVAWVTDTVVGRAVRKIGALLTPVGAFVEACLAIADVATFFLERAGSIVTLVEAVVGSVHAIATGAIGGAIRRIEQALGRGLSLALGLFARLAGLGNVTRKIVDTIRAVQARVELAIDWLLAKLLAGLKKAAHAVAGALEGKPDERTPAEKLQALRLAIAETEALLDPPPRSITLRARLFLIKRKHRLKRLEPVVTVATAARERYRIVGEINPLLTTEEVESMQKLSPIFVLPRFLCRAGMDRHEFDRQLKTQEDALNRMRVSNWKENRVRFVKEGRSAEGTAKQRAVMADRIKEFRERVVDERKRLYRTVAGTPQAAETRAHGFAAQLLERDARGFRRDSHRDEFGTVVNELHGKVAAHRLDQVAGGDPTDVELGGARVDFSLGAQWARKRIEFLDAEVAAQIRRKKKKELREIVMVVVLPWVFKSVVSKDDV